MVEPIEPGGVAWDDEEGGSTLPPLWPSLIACALTAAWITFGTIHRDQHADSLLNVLVSLQRWTPFVWEQDRFGMLVPLLATPIRDPLGNMLFQAAVASFAGLAAFTLLARYALRDPSYPIVATFGAASLLALTPPYYRFEYLVDTSYGLGLSLALGGLILVEPGPGATARRRRVGALALLILASWVNSATALFLGPFVVLRSLIRSGSPRRWPVAILAYQAILPRDRVAILVRGVGRTETARALVVLTAGHLAGWGLMGLSPTRPTSLEALPMAEWPEAWWALWKGNWLALEPPLWAPLLAIEAAVGLFGLARRGRRARVVGPVVALLATASLLWLLMGTRRWVKINEYSFRYLLPSALLARIALAGLAMASTRPGSRGVVLAGSTVIMLAAATWSYGVPSLAGVRRDVDVRCGALTDDLLAAGCTCLAGDYWTVWPAVFHANLVLHDRGDSHPFWGVSYRSMPTFVLWRDEPRDRCLAAVALGDGLGEGYLRSYVDLKIREVEARRTIRVLKPGEP